MSAGQPPRESFQRISGSAKPCHSRQKGHQNVQPKQADTGKQTKVHSGKVENSSAGSAVEEPASDNPTTEKAQEAVAAPLWRVRREGSRLFLERTDVQEEESGKAEEQKQAKEEAERRAGENEAAQIRDVQPKQADTGKQTKVHPVKIEGAAVEGPALDDPATEKAQEATGKPAWRVRREGSRLFLERTDVHEEERRKAGEERAKAERQAKEDEAAQKIAATEAGRRAREDARLRALEAQGRMREEAERQGREAAERRAREEAERITREEAERKIREAAERRAREAAGRRAREEAERKTREAAERRAREEAERVAREEAERMAREAAERRAREAERRAREEAERRAREEAERKAREAAERKAKAEKKAREKAERRAKELAERQAREAAEQKAREDVKRAEEEAARRRLEERRMMEAAVVEQYVVLDSSLVTCAAGLQINNVVTGFDLCRITVKNLPRNARLDEIVQIFTCQGVDASEFCILSVKECGNRQEAIVLANAEHGEAIALGWEGIPFRGETLAFEVSENAGWNSMGTSKRNANVLTVTWHGPAETIIATYNTEPEAQAKMGQLNMKFYKGRKIRAMTNAGWQASIRLLGFPEGTEINSEVQEFTGTTKLRMLRSPVYTVDSTLNDVRQRLQQATKVEMHTYRELVRDPKNGPLKVQVAFETWEAAKAAFCTIGTRLGPRSPSYRPFLPKPVEYTIKIPRQQYEAQRKQWDALSEKKEGPNVAYVNIRGGDRGDFFVHVEGQDKKAAGALKVRVESMVAGEKLDASYWHSSWISRHGMNFFDRVRQDTKVYVRSDFKTRSLKIYGEPSCLGDARKMIKDEVDRLAGLEMTIILDRWMVGFFIRKGLGVLKELVGEDNVSMNVAACQITIKGGQEANHHLTRLMDESRAAWGTTAIKNHSDNTTCPICYDDASNPEVLGCDHTYCSGCLRHYLHSALEGGGFPLVCLGNDMKCKVPMTIPLIHRFMPQQAFQDLVEAAFRVYLDARPQEFKYCTTPDCKQIYRHGTDKKVLQCPSCFSSICPACDEEAHEGMTCQERKVHKEPEYPLFNQWVAANGVQRCPGCRAPIQKDEGCNHLECQLCGTHFCWGCLQTFPTSGEVYDHMRSVHGNIYDQALAGMNLGAGGVAGQVGELNGLQRFRAVGVEVQIPRPSTYIVGGIDNDDWEMMRRPAAAAAGAPQSPRRQNIVENDLVRQEEQRRVLAAEARRQEIIEQHRTILRQHELRQHKLRQQQRLREAEAVRQAEEAKRLTEERTQLRLRFREAEANRQAEQARRLAEERTRQATAEEYRRQARVVRERREQQQKAQTAKEEGSWCTVM